MAAVETTGVVSGGKRSYLAGAANMARGIAVMQGADDQHVVPAIAGAQCIGINEETATVVGEPLSIICDGEAVVVYGAAVVAPAYLISNAAGQLVPSANQGDQVIARAVSSGSMAGDYGVARLTAFIR